MAIELKAGCSTEDARCDRIFEEDWRSLNFPVTMRLVEAQAKRPRSYTWSCDVWLDQGSEGACVGFGCSHELACRPVAVSGVTNGFAREKVYWEAQRQDPWPGGAYPSADPIYEGTSVLTGVKVLQSLGFYTAYHWGLTLEQLAVGIGYAGPAILGFNWYEGMMRPDGLGFIAPTGKLVGGHCILALGVKIVWKQSRRPFDQRGWDDVDLDKSYLILHNSWGSGWGQSGRCKITLASVDRLLNEQGDACFPERNPKYKKVT